MTCLNERDTSKKRVVLGVGCIGSEAVWSCRTKGPAVSGTGEILRGDDGLVPSGLAMWEETETCSCGS